MSGSMFDPREIQNSGLYGGLSQFGAALADAGRPRLIMREGFGPGLLGAIGQGGAAFGQGVQQGRQGAIQRGLLDQEIGQHNAWQQRLAGMPEDERALYSAAGPKEGSAALLAERRRVKEMEDARALFQNSGLLGGMPPQQAPAVSPGYVGGVLGAGNGGGDATPVSNYLRVEPKVAQRLETYRPIVSEASKAYGVPEKYIFAVMNGETGGRTGLIGDQGHPNGASYGVMQVQEATARNPGFGIPGVDPQAMNDPKTNIMFATRLLAARAKANGLDFNKPEDLPKIFALYNGSGPMAQAYGQRINGSLLPTAGGAPPQQQPQQRPGGVDPEAVARLAMSGNPLVQRALGPLTQLALREPPETWRPAPNGQDLQSNRGRLEETPAAKRAREDAAREQWTDISPQNAKMLGLPEGSSYQRSAVNGQIRAVGGNSGVTVNTGERSLASGLSANAAKGIDDMRSTALSAVDGVQSARRVLDILKSESGTITGAGANWRQPIEAAFTAAGITGPDRVANTEALAMELGNNALAALQKLPGSASDSDVKFIKGLTGGNIALTPQTLERAAKINLQIGERAVKEYNRVIEPLISAPDTHPMMRSYYTPVTIPDALTTPRTTGAQRGVQVKTMAEAMQLPAGTPFIDPNGVPRVR